MSAPSVPSAPSAPSALSELSDPPSFLFRVTATGASAQNRVQTILHKTLGDPMHTSFLPFLILIFAPLLSASVQIDENSVQKTIVVDPSGKGDVKRIRDAIDLLNAEPEVAMKVLIREGVYREEMKIIKPRTASATVLEGEGKVVISGADVWSDWKEENGLLYADWPYDWGLAAFDNNYNIKNDLGRRCEIVRVNDKRLTQVASKEEVGPGSFWVDEEGDRLWMRLPEGLSLEQALVEVSVRQQIFWARQVNNLVLRNVTFAHASNGKQHSVEKRFAVAVFGNSATGSHHEHDNVSQNLLIENCIFTGNNSGGASIGNYHHVHLQRCSFSDNGSAGSSPARMRFLEISECSFNDNNWRIGGYGKFYDWAPAGTKIWQCGDVLIRDSEFLRNQAAGLWLDWQHERFVIRNIKANDNYSAGLYIEASVGPFLVQDSEFLRNGHTAYHGTNHGGVLIAESRHVTLAGNEIGGNSHGQVMIRTRPRENCGGFFNGKRFAGSVKHVTITNNRIWGTRVEPPKEVQVDWFQGDRMEAGLIVMSSHSAAPMYRSDFLPTLWSQANHFSHTAKETVFSIGGDYGFEMISLEEWQKQFGQDSQSGWQKRKSN